MDIAEQTSIKERLRAEEAEKKLLQTSQAAAKEIAQAYRRQRDVEKVLKEIRGDEEALVESMLVDEGKLQDERHPPPALHPPPAPLSPIHMGRQNSQP